MSDLIALADDLDASPARGSIAVRIVPEELCRRISEALRDQAEWVRVPRMGEGE